MGPKLRSIMRLGCLFVVLNTLSLGFVSAEIVGSDTVQVGLEVTQGTETPTATATSTATATATSTATVEPTATTPAVNKLPDTGSQGESDHTVAMLIAGTAIASVVAAYGVRRGAQRTA